jgi:hypothetical protein
MCPIYHANRTSEDAFLVTFNKTKHFNQKTFNEELLGKPKYRLENNVAINKYRIKRWFRFVPVAVL